MYGRFGESQNELGEAQRVAGSGPGTKLAWGRTINRSPHFGRCWMLRMCSARPEELPRVGDYTALWNGLFPATAFLRLNASRFGGELQYRQ